MFCGENGCSGLKHVKKYMKIQTISTSFPGGTAWCINIWILTSSPLTETQSQTMTVRCFLQIVADSCYWTSFLTSLTVRIKNFKFHPSIRPVVSDFQFSSCVIWRTSAFSPSVESTSGNHQILHNTILSQCFTHGTILLQFLTFCDMLSVAVKYIVIYHDFQLHIMSLKLKFVCTDIIQHDKVISFQLFIYFLLQN